MPHTRVARRTSEHRNFRVRRVVRTKIRPAQAGGDYVGRRVMLPIGQAKTEAKCDDDDQKDSHWSGAREET